MKKTIIFILITICLSNVIAGPTDSKLQESKAVVATDQNTDIRMLTLVAENPETFNMILATIVKTSKVIQATEADINKMLEAVAKNKNVDIKTLTLIAQHPKASFNTLATIVKTSEVIEATDADIEAILAIIISHKNINIAVLKIIALHPKASNIIPTSVAKNLKAIINEVNEINLSQMHIDFLIRNSILRKMVCTNLMSLEDFVNLRNPELSTSMLLYAAQHPEVSIAILKDIIEQQHVDDYTLRCIAELSKANFDMLAAIANHSKASAYTLACVAQHPNVSLDTIVSIAKNPIIDVYALLIIAQYPHSSKSTNKDIVLQCNVDEYRNFKLTSAFISTFILNTEITDDSEIFKAITERKDIKQLDLPSLKLIVNKVNLSQVHINFLIKDKIIRRMVATGLVSPDDFASLTELELKTLEILSRNNLFHNKTDHKSFTLAQARLLNSDHLYYLAQNSTKLKNGEYSIEAFIQEYSQIQPVEIIQKEEQEEQQQKENLIKQFVAETCLHTFSSHK